MNKTRGDYKESLEWRVWTITYFKENVPGVILPSVLWYAVFRLYIGREDYGCRTSQETFEVVSAAKVNMHLKYCVDT